MNILESFSKLAPPLPDYSAQFMGIYFEPIRGSGERLTIGVMAKADNGEVAVNQTISDKTIQCMYGDKAVNFKGFVHDILSSAKHHLDKGFSIENWHPPYSGVSMTKVHRTYSKTGIKGVVFQAITAYASLCKDPWVSEIINEINGTQESYHTDPDQSIDSLVQQLKKITGAAYNSRWQRELYVNDAPMNIDYLGIKYNASLSNFDVKQVKGALRLAKSKLFDLSVFRESRKNQAINEDQGFELLVSLKNRSHEALEQFDHLERHADGLSLRVINKPSAEEIAAHIRQREAA